MSNSLAATRTSFAIGHSNQARPISVTRIGDITAELRVLVIGGQHGDEPLAREAVRRFANECRGSNRSTDVQLALVADANPDGAAARSRANAAGIDLNRDHQLLRSPETQALHRFVRHWRPHMIVDVHTYPPRRKHLLAAGLIHCHDIFLDVPTNPAIQLPIRPNEILAGIQSIAARLRRGNFLAARYVLIRSSGRIRHSTPDVIDARNMFALRYGIPTILLEGRQPSRRHDPPAASARTVQALTGALHLLVEWAITDQRRFVHTFASHTASDGVSSAFDADCIDIDGAVAPHAAADCVPIGSRYAPPSDTCSLLFRSTLDGTIRQVTLDGRYTPTVQVTKEISLPAAYAVPNELPSTLAMLLRHGFDNHAPPRGTITTIQRYHVESVTPSRQRARSLGKITARVDTSQESLDNYRIFPTDQPGGAALAVCLEPTSQYGLARYDSSDIVVEPGLAYPILRCESIV